MDPSTRPEGESVDITYLDPELRDLYRGARKLEAPASAKKREAFLKLTVRQRVIEVLTNSRGKFVSRTGVIGRASSSTPAVDHVLRLLQNEGLIDRQKIGKCTSFRWRGRNA